MGGPRKLVLISREALVAAGGWDLRADYVASAALAVNQRLIEAGTQDGSMSLDLYQIIDLRMLSGLIGELFSAEICRLEPRLIKNPNIDGYPDLCDVSSSVHGGRGPADFLKYRHGGFEVKNTFGVKKGNSNLAARDTRLMKINRSLVWKAHHRETNFLIALHSDYIERVPQILAGFYSSDLNECDWTVKQQPKVGSTMTSFCQSTQSAFEKLKQGIRFHMEDVGYERFLG